MTIPTIDPVASLLTDYVLVKRDELDKIIAQSDKSVWVDFAKLEEMTGISRKKLDTILRRYREELDIKNGGPVKFPDGGRWSIEKDGMQKWLKENHSRVWSDDLAYQLSGGE